MNNKYFLKYTLDKIVAALLIILASPVMLAIVIAMWVEGFFNAGAKGPAIYKEKRISQGNPFILYKFRTLKMAVINKMMESDSATFLQVKKENTTRIGRLLVKVYFDEMPQLFNVISGKMSFIGPRPRIQRVYQEDLGNGYTALKYLRAGISGPHQISKGENDFSLKKSEEYYRNSAKYGPLRLLVYDAGLMCKTVLKILKAEGL